MSQPRRAADRLQILCDKQNRTTLLLRQLMANSVNPFIAT